jgi:hypothetical protein
MRGNLLDSGFGGRGFAFMSETSCDIEILGVAGNGLKAENLEGVLPFDRAVLTERIDLPSTKVSVPDETLFFGSSCGVDGETSSSASLVKLELDRLDFLDLKADMIERVDALSIEEALEREERGRSDIAVNGRSSVNEKSLCFIGPSLAFALVAGCLALVFCKICEF